MLPRKRAGNRLSIRETVFWKNLATLPTCRAVFYREIPHALLDKPAVALFFDGLLTVPCVFGIVLHISVVISLWLLRYSLEESMLFCTVENVATARAPRERIPRGTR